MAMFLVVCLLASVATFGHNVLGDKNPHSSQEDSAPRRRHNNHKDMESMYYQPVYYPSAQDKGDHGDGGYNRPGLSEDDGHGRRGGYGYGHYGGGHYGGGYGHGGYGKGKSYSTAKYIQPHLNLYVIDVSKKKRRRQKDEVFPYISVGGHGHGHGGGGGYGHSGGGYGGSHGSSSHPQVYVVDDEKKDNKRRKDKDKTEVKIVQVHQEYPKHSSYGGGYEGGGYGGYGHEDYGKYFPQVSVIPVMIDKKAAKEKRKESKRSKKGDEITIVTYPHQQSHGHGGYGGGGGGYRMDTGQSRIGSSYGYPNDGGGDHGSKVSASIKAHHESN